MMMILIEPDELHSSCQHTKKGSIGSREKEKWDIEI